MPNHELIGSLGIAAIVTGYTLAQAAWWLTPTRRPVPPNVSSRALRVLSTFDAEGTDAVDPTPRLTGWPAGVFIPGPDAWSEEDEKSEEKGPGFGEESDVRAVRPVNVERWAARLSQEAKVKFGHKLNYTTANRMMVHHYLQKRLAERNTRVSHMAQVLPLAVALTFLLTKDEIEVDQMLEAQAMRKRNVEGWVRWGGITWKEWIAQVLLGTKPDHGLQLHK
jgi:hypothetical protein